jgi:hypothetical protein
MMCLCSGIIALVHSMDSKLRKAVTTCGWPIQT